MARTCAYWTVAARATVISVSPVASEIMWRWKKLSRFFTLSSRCLWTPVGKSRAGRVAAPTSPNQPESINRQPRRIADSELRGWNGEHWQSRIFLTGFQQVIHRFGDLKSWLIKGKPSLFWLFSRYTR
jgi:hypothetical protein